MLDVSGLKVSYKEIEVVHNVDLHVAEGKITVIIGANGAGKTSCIKAIMGNHKPSAGEILYCGQDLVKVAPYKITTLGISLCPEGRQLFAGMTIEENLEMGAYARKDREQVRRDLEDLIRQFPALEERRKKKARTLSGGEQEMLAVARAMMAKPRLLILDEPSWGLAPLMIEEVMRIVKKINDEGTTVLLVEQNANVALRFADYAYVLDIGEMVMEGTGKELLLNRKVQEIYLGA